MEPIRTFRGVFLGRLTCVAAFAAIFLLTDSATAAADKPTIAGSGVAVPSWRTVPTLISRLQTGGLVIYFRHAATDLTQVDQSPVDYASCTKQRNLSTEGKSQSHAIGHAFRTLGIPVGQVVSSPFCRALDTARIAFGRVEASDKLSFTMGSADRVKESSAQALRDMLSTPPAAGTNRILVSHTANLKDASGIWPGTEGVAIVFEPRGAGEFRALAQILAGDWPAVAALAMAATPKGAR